MWYPDNCIRGVLSPDLLLEGGTLASTSVFPFSKKSCNSEGWFEESINWMDDDSVIDFTLRQTKDNGEQRFKVGVAILPRSELDKIKKRHFLTQPLEYERAATQENPYHGNLLLKGEIASQVKNMIRHTLALACKIIPREDR